ncbi:MAG: GDP-mannose 4,6-dehydratase [Candidatus Obscuribacter phosphatis]|uniref:GDP-mannose 4,6-dehydratase n=1 Tax=Candidatus Obscuribacter phosphatis TaxID=1906157 RepID=A0A8J7TMM1_9BACT|nr:GDP-mannose 4,6-dehydratase [Candidatus Obscuribacter phosphatis]
MRRILITGGAGFIASHLTERFLALGDKVVAIDNFNDFYNPALKRSNVNAFLADPAHRDSYRLVEGDIRDAHALDEAFSGGPFDVVIHLAAMAGVRPSLESPAYYFDVNVNGTQRLVDRIVPNADRTRLVFASSSSVYGERGGEAFKETDRVTEPISPYAASKAANELQLYACHHATGLKVVCLRFFTVFGPRQRPDLAIHKFCHLIDEGKPVELFGDGSTRRDYTYVGDIVKGIESAMSYDFAGYDIINLGRSEPVLLLDMVRSLEKHLGKKADLVFKPMQVGDVPYTYADISHAREVLGYSPATSFDEGVGHFVDWFRKQKAFSLTS